MMFFYGIEISIILILYHVLLISFLFHELNVILKISTNILINSMEMLNYNSSWFLPLNSLLNNESHLLRWCLLTRKNSHRRIVTLCGWSAKQMISLSVLARNQTKAWARDFDATESRQENASRELDKGTQKKAVGDGRQRGAVGQSTLDIWETSSTR